MTQMLEIEKNIINRIPKGWGRYISCNEGWYYILTELDQKLSYLDPDYKILQVKEKFGTLRFYFGTEKGRLVESIMDDCVNDAQYNSEYTCEYCGSSSRRSIPEWASVTGVRQEFDKTVKLREASWVKTACDTCWEKKEEERANRMEALDKLIEINEELGLYDKEFNE